ncbi:MAG: hypothetical protein AABW47_00785 [Nanoarchaeota archaeon]
MFLLDGDLQMDIKAKKIFLFVLLMFFIIGTARADIIATMGMEGLKMISPQAGQIIDTIICLQDPIVCLSGKVVGIVQSELMEALAKTSPEVYKAVVTYNEIKSYIEQGASILGDLKINENGQIEEGIISFNEETSIKKLFEDSNAEDIAISNADYNFKTQKITFKEEGYLQIKLKDEDGKIQELNYENIAEGYLKLNESSGNVEEAEIITGKDSTYKFGEHDNLNVKAGTHLLYKDGKITVYGKDNEFKYGNLNISSFGEFTDIFENQIICAECSVDDIRLKGTERGDGILEKVNEGYLIKNGEAIYKQNLLSVTNSNEKVLIAKPDADLSNYGGNWLKQTSKNLEIKSSETGNLNLEILEGHDIFDTDAKDNLKIKIALGDGLNVEKRADEGLIPKVIQSHSNNKIGSTEINNDHLNFLIYQDDINLFLIHKSLTKEDLLGKYQSVAFELESDSQKNLDHIRVNSYNQFVMLGKDKNELVSYNKYGLPVSSKIKDNELQTIEQLRAKYPNVKFEFPETIFQIGIFGIENKLNEEIVPPYLVYLTDNFLKDNPDAVNEIKTWKYSLSGTGANDELSIYIGLNEVETESSGKIRKLTSPWEVLTHEYEHIKDYIIEQEEALEKETQLKLQQEYKKEAKVDQKDLNKGNLLTLNQKYNEMAGNSLENLYKNKKTKTLFIYFSKELNEKYIAPKIERALRNVYGVKDIPEFLTKEYENLNLKSSTKEETLNLYKNNPNQIYTAIINKISSKGGIVMGEMKALRDLNYNNGVILQNNGGFDLTTRKYFETALSNLGTSLSINPDLHDQSNNFDRIIQLSTGFPAEYSLFNENKNSEDNYLEISSTYREQPIEQRKLLVQSSNKLISETYKKLTQLAFDSGKMKVDEFVTIMGHGFCKKTDCSDKICSEYKLLCCINNPNSPNC